MAEQVAVAQLEESSLAWLALALTPKVGPTRSRRAINFFPDPHHIFTAPLTELEAAGLPASAAQFIFDGRARTAAQQEWQRTAEAGAVILTSSSAAYPERLLEIYDPPTVLWARGELSILNRPGIAVVGTRSPSPYGAGMAQMLSRDLAHRGVVILSGMARGVDTCAHNGAIEAHGKTVAVWGTGIDVIYPKENKRLAEQIITSGGTILSEYPIGTFPAPQNFPVRNRILSGISIGVLVVEGAEYSGTRITARCAMEQNRDVYAVPGNATNKNAWTPNTLIKQGAKLAASWEDIWEELSTQYRIFLEDQLAAQLALESKPSPTASLFTGTTAAPALTAHERLIMQRLRQDESVQLDDLLEQLESDLASGEVFTALFELELAGRIKQMPGKNYLKTF